MKNFLCLLPFLLLVGCVTAPVATVIGSDLDNAIAEAKNANDTAAIACYVAIQKAAPVGKFIGFFSLKEQMRILAQSQGPCIGVLP